MDAKKTGAFLKEMRLSKNLTQEELGKQIGVTNKTISRWETGNYMPPIECLMLLSDLYQISINELIAGKILKEEEYKNIAEENIAMVLSDDEKDIKRFRKYMSIIMLINTLSAIAIIMLSYGSIKGFIISLLAIVIWFLGNVSNMVAVLLSLRDS